MTDGKTKNVESVNMNFKVQIPNAYIDRITENTDAVIFNYLVYIYILMYTVTLRLP